MSTTPSSADERALFEAADLLVNGKPLSSAEYRAKQDRLDGWLMGRASLGAAQVPSLSDDARDAARYRALRSHLRKITAHWKKEPNVVERLHLFVDARANASPPVRKMLDDSLDSAALSQPSQQGTKQAPRPMTLAEADREADSFNYEIDGMGS